MERILNELLAVIRKRKEKFFDWDLTRKKLFEMAQSWVGRKVRFGGVASGESGIMLVTGIRAPNRSHDEKTLFIVEGRGKNMLSCFEFRFFTSRFLGFVDKK
ncbi:MAG: hypothetical protein PHT40_01670 [Patescibacteria group bacterium]|nr:hypothetical protein [Patescibacteria group bacterium]